MYKIYRVTGLKLFSGQQFVPTIGRVVAESEDQDDYNDKQYEFGKTLFRGNGYADLGDAVEAAGIHCEWC